MFPPGCARLATNPFPTGSGSCPITMGTVEVACLAGRVAWGPPVTMRSTLRRTNSAASAGRRSNFSFAHRSLMTMFFPSHSQARVDLAGMPRGGRGNWKAIDQIGILFGELSMIAAPRLERKPQREKCNRFGRRRQASYSCLLALGCFSASSDHPIRSRQHLLRNRETDLFGGFQIDHQLEFRIQLIFEQTHSAFGSSLFVRLTVVV